MTPSLLQIQHMTKTYQRRLILIQMLIFIGSGMTVTGLVVLVFGLIWFTTRRNQENLVEELNQ
ncbi:hypothetical protein [Exiguobacterium undae]|uniref:hypothetical protein n=1 Tax=Exiguobacterium undae TaxID=169177 RepID=UPI00047D6B72|nr:hypothetical protein [Exiguobacterium undae]